MINGIITGIMIGGVLSLTVMGIAVIYGITGIANFSLGIIGVMGAFTTWYLLSSYHWLLAVSAGVALSAILGYFIQYFLLNPVSEKGGDNNLYFILTISLGLIFTGLIRVIFPRPDIGIILPRMGLFTIGGITASGLKFFALFLSVVILIFIRALKENTLLGKKWVATSQNLKLAKLIGINTKQAFCIASGIGYGLAAIGAIMWGALYNINIMSGWDLNFMGYIIAVVGGIGNIWGGLIAALIMGMVISFSGYYLGGTWQSVMLYVIVIFVLIVSPRGIFGHEKSI